MSQLTIRFQSRPPSVSPVASNAVIIPPNGPCPGHKSSVIQTSKSAYRRGGATTLTDPTVSATRPHILMSIGFPPSSACALSCPKRVLPPPATTYPATLEVAEMAAPVVRRFTLPPGARDPAAESPTLSIFPANSAGATQWSPPSAKHSTDVPSTASSDTPPQTSA